MNVAWLGVRAPTMIEPTDIRVGIGFATSGLLRLGR